jgi:hypothetical protein
VAASAELTAELQARLVATGVELRWPEEIRAPAR